MVSKFYKAAIACTFLMLPVAVWSTGTDVGAESTEQTWISSDITALPADWWTNFISEDSAVFRSRSKILLENINEYIKGLDADNLVNAQASIITLRSNIDTAITLQENPPPLQTTPLPTHDGYTLKQYFELKRRQNETENRLKALQLENQQLTRQSELLEQRLDLNLIEYRNTNPSSSARLLTGLHGMNYRLELYALQKRLSNNKSQQEQLDTYLQGAEKKISYAASHLLSDDLSLDQLKTNIQSLASAVAKATSNSAAVQHKLLDALNDEKSGPSLILALKQQLTLVSVEVVHAQFKLELERTKLDWFLLRTGSIEQFTGLHKTDPALNALIEDIDQQVTLWTNTSQNTLITPTLEKGRSAKRSYGQAQNNARKTLKLLTDLNATNENLVLINSQVANDALGLKQGVGGLWLRLKHHSITLWQETKSLFDLSLFHISDKPVTTGGIAKAIIIFLLFWLVSWIIRFFLDRLERRQHFQNGSFYASGRVLHYIILTVAGFAALTSLGLNFGSFALIAGALSVGIGFGLQSVVLNFVSGLILLFEGSIRVGDYVELDSGLLGSVKEIRSRATLINTNDNIDVIVPNSELVANRMINWTLKDSFARMRIPFSVAYGSDKELIEKAAMEAAAEGEFCIQHTPGRKPAIRMISFGDNGMEFELRIWVNRQGVRRPIFVRSSILWALDNKFREYGITVPFPQRDLHIRDNASNQPVLEPESTIETNAAE